MLRLMDHFLISEYKYINDVEFEYDNDAIKVMRAHKINDILIKTFMLLQYVVVSYSIIKDSMIPMFIDMSLVTFIIRRYDYVTSNIN